MIKQNISLSLECYDTLFIVAYISFTLAELFGVIHYIHPRKWNIYTTGIIKIDGGNQASSKNMPTHWSIIGISEYKY